MSVRTSCAFVLAVWGALLSNPVRAEVKGVHLLFSNYAGFTHWGEAIQLENRGMVGIRAAFMLGQHFGFEGSYAFAFTEAQAAPQVDTRVKHYGGDVVLNLVPGWRTIPYLVAGWTQLEFDPGAGVTQSFDGWEAGGGLRIQVSERIGARLDARDAVIERDAPFPIPGQLNHNFFVTVGFQFALGGRPLHSNDHEEWYYAAAEAPNTDRAATETGPSSRRGLVDARGREGDGDGDGVPDARDHCPNAPPHGRVDANGCPLDSDGDGVYDGIDICPQTPADVRVDSRGCPIEISERETELLDTGMIRLHDINFPPGQAIVPPESYRALIEVGQILVRWPALQIEIGGHTDSAGSEFENLQLSLRRARAVLSFLLDRFPQLDPKRFLAVGYGETRSIAGNELQLGRARNRRVEFTVLNREILRMPIERRRFLRKEEG